MTAADDGYSGTNFDRPAWQRLKRDIEQGRINCVLTKDFSRLGRNSARMGDLLDEFFPAHRVRYISIIEGYDSQNITAGTAMTASLMPVLYELYARDISNKIRSSFHAKMEAGLFIGSFAPYGYRKDPADKNHLLPDPLTAWVVRRIFQWAGQGLGPGAIADRLNARCVSTPARYRATGRPYQASAGSEAPGWSSAAVCKLLKNEVYTGTTVQGKTEKLSFKCKQTRSNSAAAWIRVPGTHTPLVSRELFEQVQTRRISRRPGPADGFINIFSGIALCADCGHTMTTASRRASDKGWRLCCGSYKSRGAAACCNHFIDNSLLEQAILEALAVEIDKVSLPGLAGALERAANLEDSGQREAQMLLAQLKRRSETVDRLLRQLYEDRAAAQISGELFARLSADYQAEAATLAHTMDQLQKQANPNQAAFPDCQALVKRYLPPKALSRPLVQALIARIEVGQAQVRTAPDGIKRTDQTIRVVFRFSEP